jgi:CRISPR-associated protein Cmr2
VLGKEDQEKVNARITLLRLFGNEKETMNRFLDEQFGELKNEYKKKLKEIYGGENPNLKGRLVFYPTFFRQVALDVITPHNRETKTPTKSMGPIYFETVPPETTGTFYLLYFPFDLIDKEEKINAKQKEDLNFLIDSIIDMFTKYGFGAKTTSGYGVANLTDIEINGKDYKNDFNKAFEGMKNEWKSN